MRTCFEDKEFWLRLARQFLFEGLEVVLAVRRKSYPDGFRPGMWGISAYRELRAVYENLGPEPSLGVSQGTKRLQIAKYSYLLGRMHEERREFADAVREYCRALWNDPLVGFHARYLVELQWLQGLVDPWFRVRACRVRRARSK